MVVRVDFDDAIASDYSGQPAFQIDSETIDSAGEQKETEWSYPDWNKNWGYFTNVGDLKTAFLMKSIWATGKGWTADNKTTTILESISGCWKDTFDDILFNADLIKNVNGDSFTHIIRNPDTGTIVNLKPLDPGVMTSIWGPDGIIIRYEQRSRIEGKSPKPFEPEEIFHLMNNRLADQIHGISDMDALSQTILAEQESFTDMQKMIKFQVRPFVIWKLKTDDTTKIAAFIKKGENVLIAGYPAGFLGGIAIQKDLYITSTITDIEDVFTFKENTLDLFSLGGSIVAQQGASGGAVVTKENGLIGIIVTSSDGDTTDERDLRAITLSHINRSLISNSEMTLEELLGGNLLQKTLDFSSSTVPTLTKLLVDVLE